MLATVSSTKPLLSEALFGGRPLDELAASGDVTIEGDREAVRRLFGMMDDFPLWFPIVQP